MLLDISDCMTSLTLEESMKKTIEHFRYFAKRTEDVPEMPNEKIDRIVAIADNGFNSTVVHSADSDGRMSTIQIDGMSVKPFRKLLLDTMITGRCKSESVVRVNRIEWADCDAIIKNGSISDMSDENIIELGRFLESIAVNSRSRFKKNDAIATDWAAALALQEKSFEAQKTESKEDAISSTGSDSNDLMNIWASEE